MVIPAICRRGLELRLAHLLDGSGLCQFAGRRPGTADQRSQLGHLPAFLVDTHRQRYGPLGNDLGQRAVKTVRSASLPMRCRRRSW